MGTRSVQAIDRILAVEIAGEATDLRWMDEPQLILSPQYHPRALYGLARQKIELDKETGKCEGSWIMTQSGLDCVNSVSITNLARVQTVKVALVRESVWQHPTNK